MNIPENMKAAFARTSHPYYMYESIMSTPEGLEKVLEPQSQDMITAAAKLLLPTRQIHFAGNGTSYFNALAAVYPIHMFTNKLALAHQAYDFYSYPQAKLDENCGLVAISHSGGSPATVEAAEFGKKEGMKTVAISNKQDSTLGKVCDLLITSENNEIQGPKTRGYVASLLRNYLLAAKIASLSGNETSEVKRYLNESPTIADNILKNSEKSIKEFAEKRASISRSRIVITGAGYQYPNACEAALKFIEAPLVHASSWEIEEAVHGTWVSVKPKELIIILAPDGNSTTFNKANILAQGMKTIDADVWMISNNPQAANNADFFTQLPDELPEWTYSLYAILPIYLFIYYYTLALGGLHPDRAPYENQKFMDARIQMRTFR